MSPFKLINYLMMVFVYFLVMKATSIANWRADLIVYLSFHFLLQ